MLKLDVIKTTFHTSVKRRKNGFRYDMTSFVSIGDEKHHLSKWLVMEKK